MQLRSFYIVTLPVSPFLAKIQLPRKYEQRWLAYASKKCFGQFEIMRNYLLNKTRVM